MKHPSFEFTEQGSHAAIVYNNQEILKFDKNVAYFNLAFMVRDQVMIPGGKPEVAFVPVLSGFCGDPRLADVKYKIKPLGEGIQVKIIPTRLHSSDGGASIFSQWTEEDTLEVRLENDRFVWKQVATLKFLEDFNIDSLESGMHLYRFHHVDGRPAHGFQFIDPAPTGASGPTVPMLLDWIGYPEPYSGADTFRKHWKREYVSIILENPDHTFSWSELNKTKWLNLISDNRRSRPCAGKGAFYIVKSSGEALEFMLDAPSHYHHVCEWGMDFHAWCDLEPFSKNSIIPKNTEITCLASYSLVDASKVQPILKQAKRIELTDAEKANADRPAYEEPESQFVLSVLDHLDAHPWLPTSEGCSWERTGGYKPDSGCLIINNHYSDTGSWEVSEWGVQSWGNPLIPGSRYKMSAWAKVESFQPDLSNMNGTPGPQVGADLLHYNGPSVGATTTTCQCGWSPSVVSVFKPLPTQLDWTYIELITPHIPNNVQKGILKLRFSGRGKCYFSNVRWEPTES